jgi:hypothetical protein
MPKHFVIPDCQVKPGVPLDHLTWAGKFAAEKKPDVIVQIGDFADMSSLSSYDVGKKAFEGRTYAADVEATRLAMSLLMTPIIDEQNRQRKNKEKVWKPRLILPLGNHENRIPKAINNDRKLEGLISTDDLGYKDWGWEVYDFLDPINVDGIMYCHYFTSGVMGRPITTANALLAKKHMSCIAGHQQGKQISTAEKADGTRITGIIAGSFYQHDEEYLYPQGNKHWRGCIMLHEVNNGQCDEMFISLDYLRKKYGA